jgi:hypothetical protein
MYKQADYQYLSILGIPSVSTSDQAKILARLIPKFSYFACTILVKNSLSRLRI